MAAAEAQTNFWGYEVPSLPLWYGTYYVIMRATATSSSGVTVKNSIPMRGTVTVGSECLTAVQSNPDLLTGPRTLP